MHEQMGKIREKKKHKQNTVCLYCMISFKPKMDAGWFIRTHRIRETCKVKGSRRKYAAFASKVIERAKEMAHQLRVLTLILL